MKIVFSWDDGAIEDRKLFELHEKYEIPGMFFIPTKNREGRDVLSSYTLQKAESKIVSFGGHTENHTYLTNIPIENVRPEIRKNKEYLENVLGHEIEHFCLPGGKYDDNVLKIVYEYYKTVRTADTMNFRYKEGVLKPTFHFYPRGNKSLLGNALRNKSFPQCIYISTHYKKNYFELISNMIKKEQDKTDSIIMIWGHSWELEKKQLWGELENLMKQDYIKNNVVSYHEIFGW